VKPESARAAKPCLIANGRVTIMAAPNSAQVNEGDGVRGQARRRRKETAYLYLRINPSALPAPPSGTSRQYHRFHRPCRADIPDRALDKDSEGLILLTNHGDIVNAILRSENNHEEYIVTVDKPVTEASSRAWPVACAFSAAHQAAG
jgi:23S rRNA pseudouridine2604 synthase